MKSMLLTFTLAFFMLPMLVQAQCTYNAGSNPMTFSGNCPPVPGTTLIFPDNSNPPNNVDVPFTDLSGVTIQLGQNVNLRFNGATVSNNATNFTFATTSNNIQVTGLGTFSSGAGNNPNGLLALNTSLANCPVGGTCTLGNPAILPIELISFKAVASAKQVTLEWVTAGERNNAAFTIERSKDTRNWETVASVDGAGDSDESLSYQLADKTPLTGLSYYRLKQMDFDGQFSYSALEAVRFQGQTLGLFPNPANSVITLDADAVPLIINMTGHNVSGAVRLLTNGNGKVSLDISALPKGIYLVQANGRTERVVKM